MLAIAGGIAAGVFRHYAGSADSPEGILADIAFAAPFSMAGVLALAGTWRNRPTMVVASGIALLPISVVSIVLLPLVAPAAALIARASSRLNDPSASDLAVGAVIAIGLPVAFFLLLVHDDPVSWQTPDGGGGGSSDIITTVEALASLAIVAAVSVVTMFAWWAPARRPR